jgi:hypothetical protein
MAMATPNDVVKRASTALRSVAAHYTGVKDNRRKPGQIFFGFLSQNLDDSVSIISEE